jgi:hypothetical protein
MIAGIVAGGEGGPPPPSDPLWANVVVLLNMGGADGSTSFPDSKGLHTWTAVGAEVDNSLGYNAGYFPFGGAYLTSTSHADFALGTGDFTVEAWIRPESITGDSNIFNVGTPGAISFGLSAGKPFAGSNSVSYGIMAPSALSLSTMYHVEYSRASGTGRLFVDGVQVATGADVFNFAQSVGIVCAGSADGGGTFTGYMYGWIRAFRLTKGAARHSSGSSFTPPTAPFPTS